MGPSAKGPVALTLPSTFDRPHAGFERTVQFATGMQNIRDIIAFPRTPRNAEF